MEMTEAPSKEGAPGLSVEALRVLCRDRNRMVWHCHGKCAQLRSEFEDEGASASGS